MIRRPPRSTLFPTRRSSDLTDHGVMYGAVKFYKEAKDAGVKPLVGCEVYVTADRKGRSRAPYYHLTLLARTDRKSTRLNSSHANISYAVFCLKKKITTRQ